MRDRQEGGGQQLLLRPADHFAKATVHGNKLTRLHDDLGHAYCGLLDQATETTLALPQRIFRFLEVGIKLCIGDGPGNLLSDPLRQPEILFSIGVRLFRPEMKARDNLVPGDQWNAQQRTVRTLRRYPVWS